MLLYQASLNWFLIETGVLMMPVLFISGNFIDVSVVRTRIYFGKNYIEYSLDYTIQVGWLNVHGC